MTSIGQIQGKSFTELDRSLEIQSFKKCLRWLCDMRDTKMSKKQDSFSESLLLSGVSLPASFDEQHQGSQVPGVDQSHTHQAIDPKRTRNQ